jgi:hypothetical protein
LKEAFNRYLTTRGVHVNAFALHLHKPSSEEIDTTTIAMYANSQDFNHLTTLLEDVDLHSVAIHSYWLTKWSIAMGERMRGDRTAEVPELPSDEAVRQLAHRLLDA